MEDSQWLKSSFLNPCWKYVLLTMSAVFHVGMNLLKMIWNFTGCLGGSVSKASDFGSGGDLTACEFQPCVGLCADSSEPGDSFWFCVLLSLCPSPAHACTLSLSNNNNNNNMIWNFNIFFWKCKVFKNWLLKPLYTLQSRSCFLLLLLYILPPTPWMIYVYFPNTTSFIPLSTLPDFSLHILVL